MSWKSSVLITAVGGDLGTDAIRCFLEQRPSMPIVGIDSNAMCGGRHLARVFEQAPLVRDEGEYLAFMRDMVAKYGIKCILPCSEAEIRFFDKHRALFADTTVLLQSASVLRECLDKLATAQFLTSIGAPVPRTAALADYDSSLPYPLILKERFSSGSQGVFVVNSEQEFAFRAPLLRDGIVQEYVGTEDEEYTVGIFSNGVDVADIQFKRKIGLNGLSQYAAPVQIESLSALSRNVARALNLRGSINLQARKRGHDFLTFEINPRISSLVYIRSQLGFHDLIWWYDLVMTGESAIVYHRKHEDVALVARIVREVFMDKDGNPVEMQ